MKTTSLPAEERGCRGAQHHGRRFGIAQRRLRRPDRLRLRLMLRALVNARRLQPPPRQCTAGTTAPRCCDVRRVRRAAWLDGWLSKVLVDGFVHIDDLKAALGRMAFTQLTKLYHTCAMRTRAAGGGSANYS